MILCFFKISQILGDEIAYKFHDFPHVSKFCVLRLFEPFTLSIISATKQNEGGFLERIPTMSDERSRASDPESGDEENYPLPAWLAEPKDTASSMRLKHVRRVSKIEYEGFEAPEKCDSCAEKGWRCMVVGPTRTRNYVACSRCENKHDERRCSLVSVFYV